MRDSMKFVGGLLLFLCTFILQAHSSLSTTKGDNFPLYLASVRLHDTHVCSGAVLNAEWSITVAHCVEGQLHEWVTVEVNGQIQKTLKIFSHPRYSPLTMDYNIALIKTSPFSSSIHDFKSIHLAKQVPLQDEILTVFGCSIKGNEVKSVHIVSSEECNKKYRKYGGVSTRMICVETTEGDQSLCHSDGGSAVVVDGTVLGLVSHGLGCAGAPTVITKLSSFLPWIAKITSLSL